MPKKIGVFRCDSSSYMSEHYQAREKVAVESCGPFQYLPASEVEHFKGPVVAISNTHTRPHSWPISWQEKIQLIIHPNSGHDNFLPYQEHWPPLILGNSIRAQAVSEYILGALLKDQRPPSLSGDFKRQWPRKLAQEKNIQLIGHGLIGQKLAPLLKSLATKLWIFDPYQNLHEWHIDKAQVVILACSLNAWNTPLIDQKVISKLRPDVHLINAARGELIDEQTFQQFLKEHPKAFASLDVFCHEPNIDKGWFELENVHLSAHIAGLFDGLEERMLEFITQVLKDFGQRPQDDFLNHYQNHLLALQLEKINYPWDQNLKLE